MEHPHRLFLGNVLWNTTQNQIQQVLDKYKVGQGVQHIHIPRKGNFIHGIQHTIAFVTYEEKDQVEEAVTLLHDRILEGVSTYPVSAMHARSRHEGKQYPQFSKDCHSKQTCNTRQGESNCTCHTRSRSSRSSPSTPRTATVCVPLYLPARVGAT